ncbi:MAG: lysophospholipid acyltransferase family protein [Acidobacteriota bacterium]
MELKRRFFRSLIYYALRVVKSVGWLLPRRWNLWVGAQIGLLGYGVLRAERRKSRSNLELAFQGEKSTGELRGINRRVFANQGRNLFELFWLARVSPSELLQQVHFQGMEHMQRAYNKGKGVLLVTGHIGNWELMAAAVASAGYPLWVVAAPLYDPRLNGIVAGIRKRYGVRTIYRHHPSARRSILRVIEKGEVMGLLIDQDTRVKGVFVDFFGRPAYTPSSAASLALRSEAEVVMGYIVRQQNNNLTIAFRPALLPLRSGKRAEELVANTQLYTSVLEDIVRKYPEQWTWMHQRWKTIKRAHN